MSPRATAMPADQRRDALVAATLALLLEHGRTVTTKQIAQAAGVAEGTIFRVFESKDDLILAAVERGTALEPFIDDLAAINRDQDLRGRLLDLTAQLQIRFKGIFALMSAMGMVRPPRAHRHEEESRQWADTIMVSLVEPDSDLLTCRPDQLVHMVRMLTFSGTHPHISDGRMLTPDQIVGALLDGVLRKDV